MTPWLIAMLQQLQKNGVENTVLAPSYKGLGNQNVMGIDVRRFRYFPKKWESLTHDEATPVRLAKKPWYLLLAPFLLLAGRKYVKKLLGEKNFDIVHIHWPIPMAFVGAPAFGKIPTILHFYTAETSMIRRYPIIKPFFRGAIRDADKVVALTTYGMNQAKSIYDRPVEIIPYGNEFPPDIPEVNPPKGNETREILYVGRLVERKGVKYLIQAMPKILSQIDAQLTIVGGGILLEELKSIAKQENVEDKVSFTGIIPADEKDKAYRECDVFVLPACIDRHGDTEGQGVVLLEALSYGKPVVASAVGGIVDIVKNDKTGLLVPQKDPDALAEAIVRILTDEKLYVRLATDGYKYALDNFSIPAVTEKMLNIYNSVIEK